ncbi:DUF2203 domain-containing protein [Paenibacillus sp. PL2-23]|uniref:DUF2203 domain-containing protein n=1 Tax=Paenibacillus sp. PL2-23 TaxID=2100729 RepID=UPI0030FCE210
MNKRYTLEEANALLPQLKIELGRLQEMSEELEEQYIAYRKLKAVHKTSEGDPLFELESRLDFMQVEFNLYMDNFSRRGVLVKMVSPGLLDFPAIMDGEEVLLCWREGENRITHYHGWNDGYAGRRLHPDA